MGASLSVPQNPGAGGSHVWGSPEQPTEVTTELAVVNAGTQVTHNGASDLSLRLEERTEGDNRLHDDRSLGLTGHTTPVTNAGPTKDSDLHGPSSTIPTISKEVRRRNGMRQEKFVEKEPWGTGQNSVYKYLPLPPPSHSFFPFSPTLNSTTEEFETFHLPKSLRVNNHSRYPRSVNKLLIITTLQRRSPIDFSYHKRQAKMSSEKAEDTKEAPGSPGPSSAVDATSTVDIATAAAQAAVVSSAVASSAVAEDDAAPAPAPAGENAITTPAEEIAVDEAHASASTADKKTLVTNEVTISQKAEAPKANPRKRKRGQDTTAEEAGTSTPSTKATKNAGAAGKQAEKRKTALTHSHGPMTVLPTDTFKEEVHDTAVDRFHTAIRSAKTVAMHNAIYSVVSDVTLRKSISAAASRNLIMILGKRFERDPNSAFMKDYFNHVEARLPLFDFDHPQTTKCKDLTPPILHDYQNTNMSRISEALGICGTVEEDLLKVETGDKTLTVQRWEYVIRSKIVSTEISNGPRNYSDIHEQATQLPGSFVNREKANAKLDEITRYGSFEDGMAVITRRHVYEDNPSRLLRVELTLNTGEEHVMWVERRLVNIQTDLNKKERKLKKWSALRPKLPHYIVECEFMTQKLTQTPQLIPQDSASYNDYDTDTETNQDTPNHPHEQIGFPNGEIELDRLPLTTFTEGGLANEYAGKLFLRHSAVQEQIRGPLDDFWWMNNAVAIHGEAEKRTKELGKLYAAEMYTGEMHARLGFDWMRVAVYRVDDINGPLNI
ncbi:hypothetical protein F5Y11DRAFT_361839 [Daldinia sp. FL1419]|nr:hypothetical protein F5Y11DRAFT_361839 [Daldinia sp. FL1419]